MTETTPSTETTSKETEPSVVLTRLGLKPEDLVGNITDGIIIFERGKCLGYATKEQLNSAHQNLQGPNGRPGATGFYVVVNNAIHSFVSLEMIPVLQDQQ